MTTDEAARVAALEDSRRSFRADLVEAGLLVPMGINGLYGRDGQFEDIVEGVDRVVRAVGTTIHGCRPKVRRFPPLYPVESFEKTDYIASFPNLTGAVSTFAGDDNAHRALLSDRSAGLPWDGHLQSAGTMLVSAACHPGFATVPSVLPQSGELLDILGYCFRHEPSIDPARMQAFRQHEFVAIGSPDTARGHRDIWVRGGLDVLTILGLAAEAVPANDPFFGRAGRMLAVNQRSDELKTELVVRLYGDLDDGTAVASINCHLDHFGQTFGISTADGAVAHSACVGFGMERIALALLRTHGLDSTSWPVSVRSELGW